MSPAGTGGKAPAWYPPPLPFPSEVNGVVRYISDAAPSLALNAPLLAPEAIRSTFGRPLNCDALIAAQEALSAGRFAETMGLVAPFYYQHLHAGALYALASAALMRLSTFAAATIALNRLLGADERPSLYRSLAALGSWLPVERPDLHPEADAMTLLCDGAGIDVGCGGNKTVPWAVGVDLTPGGEKGVRGCQKGEISRADVASSGDDLPMFADDALDFVVSRHNYEHYQNPVAPLREWARILAPGGRLGIVTPDHDWVDTISLDLSHRHAFSTESLARIVGLIPGLTVVWSGSVIPRWSIGVVAVKEGGAPFDYAATHLARETERLEATVRQREATDEQALADQCRAEIARLEKGGGL